jgi:hypothetical protein
MVVDEPKPTAVIHEAPERDHGEDPVTVMLGGAEHDDELAKQADPGRPEDAGVGEEGEHVHEPGGAHKARVNSFVFLVLRNSERVLGYQITELRVLGRTTE